MNAEVQFDLDRAESLRIFPKKERSKAAEKLNVVGKVAYRALKASEKELKFIMDVANERGNDIKKLVKESAESGLHLVDSPFVPEYLGFKEVITGDIETIRIYGKQGFSITHIGDSLWLVYCPNGQKPVLRIRNMYEAIMILGAAGINLTFEAYFNGEYSSEKPIEQSLKEATAQIFQIREDAKKITRDKNEG